MLAVIVSRGAGLLASIPVARLLGKEGFGEYGIIYSTMVMLSMLVGGGLNMTTAKYVAEYRVTDPGRSGRIIALSNLLSLGTSLLLACSLLVTAPWLADRILSAPKLAPLLAFSSAALFFNVLNQAQNGTLSGLEAFRSLADRNCWIGLVRFTVTVSGTLLWGLYGAVAAMTVTEAAMWLLNELAIRRECRRQGIVVALSGCLSEIPILRRFSIPAALGGALMGPITWSCNALLVNQPSGFAQMGLYTVALQWRTLILFVPLALNSVLLPMLSSLFGAGNVTSFRKLLVLNVAFYGLASGILALVISIFSPYIVRFYGNQFSEGTVVLVLVAFSSVFIAIQELLTRALASLEAMWEGFAFQLASGAFSFGLTFLFTGWGWGAAGLAGASIFASFATVTGQTLWLRHYQAQEQR